MFVYQNKDGHICVTFTDNKPVESPEYVIAVDKDAKALYMVSGTIANMPEVDDEVAEDEVIVDVPSVEELDDVVENDAVRKDAVIGVGTADAPSVDTLDDIEDESYNKTAPLTEADSTGAPSVEELDDVAENGPFDEVTETADEEEVEETAE